MNGQILLRSQTDQWTDLGGKTLRLGQRNMIALAVLMVAIIAVADYATGYEVRLAILYLLPIALATWAGGRPAGYFLAMAASLSWYFSFESSNFYSRPIYFVWETATMVIGYLAFIELLARLRTALTHADTRFVSVIEELFDGVYVTDTSTDAVLYANRRLAMMVEKDPRAMRGAQIQQRFRGGASATVSGITVDNTGSSSAFSASEVCDDTSGCWYLLRTGLIPWPGGRMASLRVLSDITAHKRAGLAKRQQEEEARNTARMVGLGEIAATLTHEVNQPLAAIGGYTTAGLRLLDAARPDLNAVRNSIAKSREQAVRAGRIVNRMRDFIRRRRPELRHCDVKAVIAEAVALLQPELDGAGISVRIAAAPEAPRLLIDRLLIVQVLSNLIQNAIDAMRSMEPARRRLEIEAICSEDDKIMVSVTDHGGGVASEVRHNLFTAFCTGKPDGVGLGLSICRSVIEAHDGRLWHDADVLEGSVFRFELPLKYV